MSNKKEYLSWINVLVNFVFAPLRLFSLIFHFIHNYFKVKNDLFEGEVIWNAFKVCVAAYHDPIEQSEIFQKASSIKCYTTTSKGHSGVKVL